MSTIPSLRRGETWTILLDDVDGTIAADVVAITADLRRGILTPPKVHPVGKPKVASFEIAARASEGQGDPAGWTLTLSDEASALVPAGGYVVDARLTFAGGTVLVTDPLPIRCVEPATVPA
ncbi:MULTISPECIES: hypothetical protein [unclassified Sphingopyxis]|uniref:hypothetical protein n=1 Tax=unclassified Sphingopyxis TaxID=2614943 RepID=UPI0007303403|nr:MULTISPECIES: hypothetical protein [unclassified Sphingopyxis]KTE24475.1 hypothetical protein ATE61_13795 [Sphingopyxis sp. H057]KTE51003.1 hypothetical protein ATE69_17495 [Sphingopyxis sp. H071]KTE52146.1 hypothetical protein ATE64_12100 [Sphingopyxis sp. H073]KTE60521.1 hypothetical protein ATE66_08045 [Sphingopyxis sp. H107]KTE63890.1 hypothetical protein ATE65_13890 [Sphingopyxis sp. H100]